MHALCCPLLSVLLPQAVSVPYLDKSSGVVIQVMVPPKDGQTAMPGSLPVVEKTFVAPAPASAASP